MPHRYDASTKYLLDVRLADWLPLSGRSTTARLRIINADISTVTAAADRVLLVEEVRPWILHVELQSGRDVLLADRTQMYNTLIGWQQGLPVRRLIVLLRPAADGPELNGVLRGVTNMKESVTYQAIVEEGRLEEARQMLLDLGAERFGQPSADVEEVINQTADVDRLRRLVRRLLHVATWQELLAEA